MKINSSEGVGNPSIFVKLLRPMNESFYTLLSNARDNQSLVALYTNIDNPRGFLAGWVEAVSENHVVLRHLSPEGRYDGYVLKYLDGTFRVDSEGRYIERLAFLFETRKQSFPTKLIDNHDRDANLIVELLSAAQKAELMVNIEIAADDFESGAVKNLDFDTVTIEVYDPYGAIDREATIHLESISEVRVDSERLQSLKMMSQWHQIPGLE